ncbi:hypothetical protein BDV98DRAFT_596529 [Pterulicium gracile]|uniref:F-box domain-containing protein n=1 Tax=Pterulicium gracile TaxID=1884261 RepID=A0A5C3QB01_9AGAR|nr:hypothetical protein BDV98DRAFT_596529 [Pterula gracilis]
MVVNASTLDFLHGPSIHPISLRLVAGPAGVQLQKASVDSVRSTWARLKATPVKRSTRVTRGPTQYVCFPTELLQRIFLQNLPVIRNAERPGAFDGPANWYTNTELLKPLTLFQVSSQWRHSSLGLAPLWSFIFADLADERATAMNMLKTWLEGSGAFPLTIVCFSRQKEGLYNSYKDETQAYAYGSEVLSMLFSVVSRWQDVFLGVDSERFGTYSSEPDWLAVSESWPEDAALKMDDGGYLDFPPDFVYSAPHLRTLITWPGLEAALMVGVNRILSSSSGVERIDLFGTDRLRDDFEWNYSSSLLMTPPQTWTRLSSIYLRSITSNTASIFLRTLADSAIEDIHITITEPEIVAVVPPTPIVLLVQAPRPTATLEKLRSLAVESRIPHLPPVFNAITVPTLEKLSVELYGSEDTEEWSTAAALRTSLAALWERCTCPPQTQISTQTGFQEQACQHGWVWPQILLYPPASIGEATTKTVEETTE